jgi:hypothetical protein
MDFWARLADWDEVTRRSASGTLARDLQYSSDEKPWLSDVDFEEPFWFFTAMARAYESLQPHVSPGTRNLLAASLDKFVQEEPEPWYELPRGLDPEHHLFAIDPAEVSAVAEAFAALDLQELKKAYAQYCPNDVRADVGESPEAFTDWLTRWIDLFKQASQEQQGLIVSIG